MTKRPSAPPSYSAALRIEATPETRPETRPKTRPEAPDGGAGEGASSRARRPLEDAADPSVLYLHPTGKKALRLYAVEKGVKVHDLLLEAVEVWAAARGLAGPWRVPSSGPPRRRRSA